MSKSSKAIAVSFLALASFAGIARSASAITIIRYSNLIRIASPQIMGSALANSSSIDFMATAVQTSTTTGATVGTSSFRDVTFNTFSSGTLVLGLTPNVGQIIGQPTMDIHCVSLTPSIATIDSSCSTITSVGTGIAKFNAIGSRRTRQMTGTISSTAIGAGSSYAGFAPTSAAYNIYNFATSTINGKTPGTTAQALWSSVNDTTHTYVKNASGILAGVNTTCIPAYNSSTHSNLNGILIGSDIMLEANHAHAGAGSTYYFVDGSNNTQTATVLSGSNIAGTDVYISRLSSAPTGITPCPLFTTGELSGTGATHFSTTSTQTKLLPVFYERQNRNIYIGMLYDTNAGYVTLFKPTTTSPFLSWYSAAISGDSGSPAFTVVNGSIAALGVWYTSDLVQSSNAPDASFYKSQIQTAVTNLGSAATIGTVSLSGFASY